MFKHVLYSTTALYGSLARYANVWPVRDWRLFMHLDDMSPFWWQHATGGSWRHRPGRR